MEKKVELKTAIFFQITLRLKIFYTNFDALKNQINTFVYI